MKITRGILGLKANQFEQYNVDCSILRRPIDILIGVKHCQMNIIPLEVIMDKTYLHPYLTVLETYVGKGYSLQGTIGGCSKDYSHPIKSKRRELKMTKQQLEVILEEGISGNARKLKPEVLVGLLGSHVLEFHGGIDGTCNVYQ